MKIIFIGAGNLATNLAIELKEHSFSIIQVYSRTSDSAKLLANKIGCEATTSIKDIKSDADLYIFSVKDDALTSLLGQMPENNGIWIHTAGSVSIDIFSGYHSRYGVIYPFQTFSKTRRVNFSEIPFFIEANTQKTLHTLYEFSKVISKKVIDLPSDKRKYLHLTGVFACNFVNHLYRISEDILKNEEISFDLILPLIEETASKVKSLTPQEAQTGPAIRYDEGIINKHLSLLTDGRRKEIYRLMSEDIYVTNKI